MKLAIIYATTEGQTRKIARFAADRLTEDGHSVELVGVQDADDLGLSRFDGALLAGSVHLGRYQKELSGFAKAHAEELSKLSTLFLSVSLSAAGDDPEDWKGLEDCLARFSGETGWTPTRTEHVAGAFRFTEYDFFRAWAMRWIADSKGEELKRDEDKEYTDWAKLGSVLDEWAASLA